MKRFISLLTVLLLSVGLFFCTALPASVQSGSSVWKISRDGNTLFLGGSIHILRNEDFPLPKEFDRAFSQSALLVLEADTEQTAEIVQYLMSQMYLPNGQTLRSILDLETYNLLRAAFAEYRVPIEAVHNFKPSLVVTMLQMLQFQKLGFVQQGVDAYYLDKAHTENKPVAFLETVEMQINLFVSMGEGYENDYVRSSLNELSNTENDLEIKLTEWKTGKISSIEASLTEMREYWPAIYKAMVTDRNAAWMPQIEEYLTEGQVAFVIVGLAHLHGPDGLLIQLENSGCIVEKL
ncbi:MAG: TraB/GumN family protein [Treponema sp.]|jgi:uncharacterized protein YbaP (TraB family)|nr:TraB/GumN family protein [Treponema sp.]